MALDYNFDPAAEKRTLFGEAEYQLKYRKNLASFDTLKSVLTVALDWLPIPDNGYGGDATKINVEQIVKLLSLGTEV